MHETPPIRQVQIIANPISGVRGHARALPRFLSALEALGVERVVTPTEAPGHATELAREACARGREAIVAVGGDGTVNEVLNGLAEGAPVALGTLPTGTSNILARDLRIPFDPIRAAGAVARGRRRMMDVGQANGHRFLMVVGIGWDAHVVNVVTDARQGGHLGKHRYLGPIARAVFQYEFPALRARVDGEDRSRPASLAFVCNTRNYAAWFALTPRARPDDGLLDFLLLGDGAARNYVRWAIAAFRGNLPRYREVDYRQGREIVIESDRPVPYQVDGDPGGETPVRIRIEDSKLEVIVP